MPEQNGFPIVGIGASTGGITALASFFSGMSPGESPDMAFVVVLDSVPGQECSLAEIVRRCTRLEVFEVECSMSLRSRCVYVVPQHHSVIIFNGSLQLLEPSKGDGKSLRIDAFFQSLAQDQHERAIAVILSGTGNDGTVGVRSIKAEGGMVMAQTPGSTEFGGLPMIALGVGLVDFELPPDEMLAQLVGYVTNGVRIDHWNDLSASNESELRRIFTLLRAQTSHDFSQYKISELTQMK